MNIKAKPKLDLVFKKIFGDAENTELLIDFLSSVLNISTNEIIGVEIIDNEIVPDTLDKKFSRLDLLLKTSKGYINIEIQVNNYGDYKERAIFYCSKTFTRQLEKGEDYSELEPAISINILDFNLFHYNKAHSTYRFLEIETYTELSEKIRIDFLELPKAKKYKENTRLQRWLDFLNVTTEEGLKMLEQSTTTPETIRKAVAIVRKMSADEKLLLDIEKREKALRDEQSALNYAKREGAKEERERIIKEMYNNGATIEYISKITKYSIEIINKVLEV